ncbi:hypothetical protein N1851_003364 [Merluccius polli]|uniref:Uncharacterized protein n=1 Tax=Merluccius polli TaxID=89951 RepID=A0AA47N9Y6_MERPO|nr:hypothetical protein N1851_003364 [Merluccius polli]
MERPTKPVCNPEVVVEMGQTVVLSCSGSQATVLVLLMVITISAIVFFCRIRRSVENFGNDIRVDEPPPHQWLLKKRQQAVPKMIVLERNQVGTTKNYAYAYIYELILAYLRNILLKEYNSEE